MTNHEKNALAWCKYIGQRGTEKQVRRAAASLAPDTLCRMLAERGLPVAG